MCNHVHAFRASSPTGWLAIHVVKPIIACVMDALQELHSRGIIHAGLYHYNPLLLSFVNDSIL